MDIHSIPPVSVRGNDFSLQQQFSDATTTMQGQRDILPSTEQAKAVVDSLNELMKPLHTHVQFKMHDKLNEYYITLIDTATEEVVKEIPPKKLLDAYYAMLVRFGVLVDEKV
ncbi:flagellar protein FlaG [Aureibacillus halotolerans]|uniref:Flagellar protein FlaG n=1 Tax=Aureibacillus halotolerans TaxID=1508390 RepID=A0A4R6TY36_9BACI|nr:flagellar protein FlaG [Aureibacillus halotolerans]TDQ36939.1 flagellar protein FlaG [Aureibacillus halotolerans]